MSSYYAVLCGRQPGIYLNFENFNEQVKRYSNAKGKRFEDEEDAWNYFTYDNLLEPAPSTDPHIVWIHGSCIGNGKAWAQAGIGVFWGYGHPGNQGEALNNCYAQTNNVAYLIAAYCAVKFALDNNLNSILILTNSQYLIDACTKKIHQWKARNWIKMNGQPVRNRSVILQLRNMIQKFIQISDDGSVMFEHRQNDGTELGIQKAVNLAKKGCL